MAENFYGQSLDAYGQVTEISTATPEQVWDRARQYFEWVKLNPLIIEKAQSGRIVRHQAPRAMTLTGFRVFVGIDLADPQYQRVVEMALDVMNEYNLSRGMVEVFNPMLIARTMGLPDKAEIVQAGSSDPKAPPLAVEVVKAAVPRSNGAVKGAWEGKS